MSTDTYRALQEHINAPEVERSTYLGGPDAAAILGVSPWETPVSVWLRKTGRSGPVEMNDAMRSGQRLEPAVLAYAADELHQRILPGPFVRELGILGGHLDGITQDSADIVEAKTAHTRNGWGDPGTGDVPPHVVAQAMHYLGLMKGAKVCYVPVLFSGLEFALYRLERDDALIAQIQQLCRAWWEEYVVTDTPPPPQTGADASLLYPKDAGKVVIADDAVAAAVAKLRSVREMEKALEEEREMLEGRIKLAMADAAVLTVNGETAVTWKSAKPSLRFDSSAFKAAQPALYAEYSKPVESRRFLIKDNK